MAYKDIVGCKQQIGWIGDGCAFSMEPVPAIYWRRLVLAPTACIHSVTYNDIGERSLADFYLDHSSNRNAPS